MQQGEMQPDLSNYLFFVEIFLISLRLQQWDKETVAESSHLNLKVTYFHNYLYWYLALQIFMFLFHLGFEISASEISASTPVQ